MRLLSCSFSISFIFEMWMQEERVSGEPEREDGRERGDGREGRLTSTALI